VQVGGYDKVQSVLVLEHKGIPAKEEAHFLWRKGSMAPFQGLETAVMIYPISPGVNWIGLAQDSTQWKAVVNVVLNLESS
jgi:hypothetical protein